MNLSTLNQDFLAADEAEPGSGFAVLKEWYTSQNPGKLKLACSLQREDIIIIHKLQEIDIPFTPYVLDTGRLHGETYWMIDRLRQVFGLEIEHYLPQPEKLQKLLQEKGPYSFKQSVEARKECCYLRKVAQNQIALQGVGGYFTGIRRAQNVTRKDTMPFMTDEANGNAFKISPLVLWSDEEVNNYITRFNLPDHPLYQKGFPSIGCQPCTRPLQKGETDPRSGRWWWESPEHKECGLHFVYNEYQ
jgi:phosphoadenosine phosphosulfate reductase